jgi:hypothetical protein
MAGTGTNIERLRNSGKEIFVEELETQLRQISFTFTSLTTAAYTNDINVL